MLEAWREFLRGKRGKPDVQAFQARLMDNVLALHGDLKGKVYVHGGYRAFNIADPKPRNIHKASVRDRLLHHALYRVLYPFFDRTFIYDSYSCREEKGTHAAMRRFAAFGRAASRNHTRTCWVLKCDIRKFFASIDHEILKEILSRCIADRDALWLLGQVVDSFPPRPPHGDAVRRGLPLGNLTSQLLVNVYMNEFDQFVKHRLKCRHYIRYADDFVILSHDRAQLERLLPHVEEFLRGRLKLELHPEKVFVKTLASGVDFLGWVHFPHHRVLRTASKRRMLRRLSARAGAEGEEATRQSYLGLLSHGNARKLQETLLRGTVLGQH